MLYSSDILGRKPEGLQVDHGEHDAGFACSYQLTFLTEFTNVKGAYYDLNSGSIMLKLFIAKTYEQLSLALDHQANRIWILNVGDLKPYELNIEFFITQNFRSTRIGVRDNINFFTLKLEERGRNLGETVLFLRDKRASNLEFSYE